MNTTAKKDYAIEIHYRNCTADVKKMAECRNYSPGIPPKFCRYQVRYSQECKSPRKDAK